MGAINHAHYQIRILINIVARVLAAPPCVGARHNGPLLISDGDSPFHVPLLEFGHECGIFCKKRCDDDALLTLPQEAIEQSFTRRHVGLSALRGLVFSAGAVHPMQALADAGVQDGPEGLKYRDLAVGDLDAPSTGDAITIKYILYLPATGAQIDKGTISFLAGAGETIPGLEKAVMGQGKMPSMRMGGTRKVFIPPKLAYDSKEPILLKGSGKDCPTECSIPPGSALEFTIALVNIINIEVLRKLNVSSAQDVVQYKMPADEIPAAKLSVSADGFTNGINIAAFVLMGVLGKIVELCLRRGAAAKCERPLLAS